MGEISERNVVLQHVFNQYDRHGKGELAPHEIQSLHGDIRMGGISYPQVLASMKYVCACHDTCSLDELHDLLQEMDRRYFLMQDLRWEFSLLDREHKDTITEDQARWMVQAVHGKNFSRHKWADFLCKRAIPGTSIALPEIEVLLCNVKSSLDVILDREEEDRERQERVRREKTMEEENARLRRQKEEEKRRKEQDVQKFLESLRRTPTCQPTFVEPDNNVPNINEQRSNYKRGEAKNKEEERRRRMMEEEDERRRLQQEQEDEERLREEARLRELEERNREESERRRVEELEKYKDADNILEDTEEQEKALEEALRQLRQKKKEAKDEKTRKDLEEEEKRLQAQYKELKHKRIRYSLKVAIKDKDKFKLEYSINEFKTEKVEDKDMELEKAERLLKELVSRDNLRRAMSKREIEQLEKAISTIKKNGLEVQLAKELIEANVIMTRLRKIQRIRAEILELKQSTVAEIRSYQNPPPVVHTVMTATFLVLGHKEKETKVWKTVQALVGKTGKEGLKRRCLECDASKIGMDAAKRAKQLLDKHELDEVRDVSAGAATFYVFSVAMVEEYFDIEERGPEVATEMLNPVPVKPRVDPTKMVISRSKKMVTTSGPSSGTRGRSKTPPARRK